MYWRSPQVGQTTKVIFDQVNQRLRPGSISRASVINFLEEIAMMGVLSRSEITGKGGYRGVFTPKMDESEFKTFIVATIVETLMRNFPEETKRILEKVR